MLVMAMADIILGGVVSEVAMEVVMECYSNRVVYVMVNNANILVFYANVF